MLTAPKHIKLSLKEYGTFFGFVFFFLYGATLLAIHPYLLIRVVLASSHFCCSVYSGSHHWMIPGCWTVRALWACVEWTDHWHPKQMCPLEQTWEKKQKKKQYRCCYFIHHDRNHFQSDSRCCLNIHKKSSHECFMKIIENFLHKHCH